ncbi:PAS domain-containing protein [Streptomyces sp. NPDC056749]|uniref:PAS domain-containing protein n=1 Tax=Streptomyces sp. NPDC056749 TaxID=3345936 RepID=UPI00367A8666
MSSRPSRGAARLAAILDALPDGLLLVNCNGTVVNANTIALEMFETPGTALVGRGLLDLLPEFDSRLIPGSMRRPESADEQGRTKPTRMTARRTDGTEYPVEVTSASLDSGQAGYNDIHSSYTGDELLMLVVRDLSGTVDTEAELARSQRQTEMILRAASEGVVGTDTDGRVVLVNPAAAQILGFRASDLGGQELHPLILHSRAEGGPFPYEESPLADTLRSGRKHRVRGQVLWSKSGAQVPVDLTTAPVRDGDQLVGAVMTFTDRRPYEEQTQQHTDEVSGLTERHEAAVTGLTERHTAEVTGLTERHEAEIAELTEKHRAQVEALTEQHAAESADRTERYAAELEEQAERLAGLGDRHTQLTAVLGESLRGPLEELRGELSALAADPAGQLWPEANQILHHLAAGYARMTTLVDNVLSYQRLDTGSEELVKQPVLLDAVVTAGIDGAVELIGPGRAQFAVHAPAIEAEVDAGRLITALAHLVADVAGVDSTGKARQVPGGGYVDSTVVVAAAQRGEVVRIEVRGPFAGGDPVHVPIVRGIVRAHGGVLQTHEMPGMSGSAYVLEVPLGTGAGTIAPEPLPAPEETAVPEPAPQPPTQGGRRRARRASTDAFLDGPVDEGAAAPESGDTAAAEPTGRRRARRGSADPQEQQQEQDLTAHRPSEGSGRRRGRPSPAETGAEPPAEQPRQALALPAAASSPSEGSVVTAAEGAQGGGGRPQLGPTVPPQGVPQSPSGRSGRQGGAQPALPALTSREAPGQDQPRPEQPQPEQQGQQPGGRRARRALAAAQERAAAAEPSGPRTALALPPAAADRIPPPAPGSPVVAPPSVVSPASPVPQPVPAPSAPRPTHSDAQQPPAGDSPMPERHDAVRTAQDADHTPPQPHPAPSGRRRARPVEAPEQQARPGHPVPGQPLPAVPPQPDWSQDVAPGPAAPAHVDAVDPAGDGARAVPGSTAHTTGSITAPAGPVPAPDPSSAPEPHPADSDAPAPVQDARRQPLPAEEPMPASADSTQGRAFSVRTLGQGVPFAQHLAHQQNQTLGGAGRRRKLAAPPEAEPQAPPAMAPVPPQPAPVPPQPAVVAQGSTVQGAGTGRLMSAPPSSEGRSYAIGAPDEGAEGPEPLDGPGGAVEVANRPQPQPVDDELPPEPLDNPRRLLVWPAPDVSTQQALSDRGYRPVIVHSREEVDAQIAAFPAALFVDPLTGPITRTALQSLRQAAVAAEVPVLVTAGLGQATREAAYGADPAVLLKALAPRDSDQHPPRVLVIEEHEEIALALTETLERRGMQVARASGDSEAVDLATRMRPNLVVMDLMQVRRRRAGIIDWLRANGALNHTPLVVYTSAGMEEGDLPRLASGETVLFLAERSTSDEVQARIVDLLAKIGTN